jgi:hypothetical protein
MITPQIGPAVAARLLHDVFSRDSTPPHSLSFPGGEDTGTQYGCRLPLKLHETGLIDPMLFSLGDDLARDYKAYRAANRARLEEYMDKFRHAARSDR